jgi:hypothetical protein
VSTPAAKPTPAPTTWGPWTLDRDVLVLNLEIDGGWRYEVDLERCPTAAAVLDWLAQIEGKRWATTDVLGHLVSALCDLLEPQARLCSWGMSRRESESSEEARERILAAEVRTRAHRLSEERRARAAAGDKVHFRSAEQIGREHDEAVAEVRREFGQEAT